MIPHSPKPITLATRHLTRQNQTQPNLTSMTTATRIQPQTTQIIALFNETVDKTKVYNRSELGKMLTSVYHNVLFEEKKKSKLEKKQIYEEKKNKKIDNKKKPNPYQLFVKEQMPRLKKKNPNATSQENFKKVCILWNQKKEAAMNAPTTRSKSSITSK
jgi:tRNA A37 threonylcarbamoyladenosine dehydratase